MDLPPRTAAQLERIRAQIATGRADWQRNGAPMARIPVENYVAAEVRSAEIEALFRPLPLIVGHANELKPAHVLAHDDYGLPLLLSRDADGRFRAFFNVCRHRGMRLVESGDEAQARTAIVCPYHGWTYRLDGSLRHRLHAESFDACSAADESLVELPAEERHGLLWVVPTAGAAIDVAAWLGDFDAELPFFAIDGLRLFRTVRCEVAANWKLIVDAFLESYHIRVLHKDTIYPFFVDGVNGADRLGPHIASLVARRAAQTWTAEAAAPPRDMAGLCALATPSQVIFPNTITIFHPDYLSLITIYPTAPTSFHWTHRMLIPADKTTPDWAPHWEKTFDLIEKGVFQKEDIACAIGIQKGMASGANRFVMAGRAEQGVGWFHDEIAKRIGSREHGHG